LLGSAKSFIPSLGSRVSEYLDDSATIRYGCAILLTLLGAAAIHTCVHSDRRPICIRSLAGQLPLICYVSAGSIRGEYLATSRHLNPRSYCPVYYYSMPNIVPRIDQLVGQVIDDGRLCLVDPLGQGSGGVVFRAIDLCSSTPYAVKCMVKGEPGTRQANFQKREIHLHSSVSSHATVVSLHKVIEEDGYIFLVLDYCSGGDLFKFLTARGTYVRNDALVKDVMLQLINGLEHCHRLGVFHRDIKPENIMCNKDGTQLKLGDFGLATDTKCSENFGAGTSGYMSPGKHTVFGVSLLCLTASPTECIGVEMGEKAYDTAANDVWALGIIFTSMISGHNPWRRAVMSDDCFRLYIHNPDFFRLMLPISTAADDILRNVFAPSEIRLSLADFRRKIVNATTFFLTDDEIAGASKFVQLAAASYLCDITAQDSFSSSIEAMLDVEVAETARCFALESKSEPPLVPIRDDPCPLCGDDGLRADRVGAEMRKRPAPPPQRMPSFKDLIHSSSGPSHPGPRTKKRVWRSQSPVGLFKRIMDKIFVD
jgi:serine/threonine protein kinase